MNLRIKGWEVGKGKGKTDITLWYSCQRMDKIKKTAY
jgi:hypothetical protein